MAGRAEDAALLCGFADRAYAERELPRQHVEQFAAERLHALLHESLALDDIDRLLRDGALLTEASAWAIAARDDPRQHDAPTLLDAYAS